MKPLVERLQKEYAGKIEFRRYNLESDQEGIALANGLGVSAVPTFVFVNGNGVQSNTTVGGMTEEQMRAQLDKLQ